jgi:hypothetical protein
MRLPATAVAGMHNLQPLQCVLVIDQAAFMVVQGNTWLDNLHIITVREIVTPDLAAISIRPLMTFGTNVFITNTTFQGEGPRSVRALEIPSSEGGRGWAIPSSQHSVLLQGMLLHATYNYMRFACMFGTCTAERVKAGSTAEGACMCR